MHYLTKRVNTIVEAAWKKLTIPVVARGKTAWPKSAKDQEIHGIRFNYDGEVEQDGVTYHKFQVQSNAGKVPTSVKEWRDKNGGTHSIMTQVLIKKNGTKIDVLEAVKEAFKNIQGSGECVERYNEAKRRKERYLEFNIPALLKVAATSVGRLQCDITAFKKIAEGGFNRVFRITMADGFEMIARLPYPAVEPKQLTIASEVATLDFIRSQGIPVPKLYDYSCKSENEVGAEYILMEKVAGRPLAETWFDLSEKQRSSLLSQLVDFEAKLFEASYPASGSLFHETDLPANIGRVPVQSRDCLPGLCVGPDVSTRHWHQERAALKIERGPCMRSKCQVWEMRADEAIGLTAQDVLEMAARKEMAWIRQFGKPRLPFDRHHRDITNFQQVDPQEHMKSLEQYLRIAPHLLPLEDWLRKPVLRHPDLNPNNIFVADDCTITGLLDWQHTCILPLFLNLGIPRYFQNYGDLDSKNLVKPQLPSDLDEWDEDDQKRELERYRRRHLHFYYVETTATKNKPHFDAMMYDGGLFRRRIFRFAGSPWEGNNIALKADLIRLSQAWSDIASPANVYGKEIVPPCPISFGEDEVRETLEAVAKQELADGQVAILRNFIGVSSEGWVSNEGYDEALAIVIHERKEAEESFDEGDPDRELQMACWPFDDHDEDE